MAQIVSLLDTLPGSSGSTDGGALTGRQGPASITLQEVTRATTITMATSTTDMRSNLHCVCSPCGGQNVMRRGVDTELITVTVLIGSSIHVNLLAAL